MNWQSAVYREEARGISLAIDAMFAVADIVYVPDAAAWARTARAAVARSSPGTGEVAAGRR